ncbi:hepatic lectin-like [Mobula hypostoma]|uniref:hepatic lectin-like n=1 Tax=Mobula hypostoma TaxID=723540 RepID=UPI002FC36801
MEPSDNYELAEDSFQLGKWNTGYRGPRADLIQGNFFPLIISTLLLVSLLMSAVTLGIVVNLKNSQMTNGSLTKLQGEVSQRKDSIDPAQSLNIWRPFKESEYYFSSTPYLWKEAEQLCESMNSKLVVINNREEQGYIRLNVNHDSWIGLYDIIEEGKWRWVDGTDYASNVKFWANNQPNVNEQFDEDCAVVSENGSWHDWPCDSLHFAICERPAA